MKIIFLNLWNAKLHDELAVYIQAHAADTDIFCFQEVHPDARALCLELLSDFTEVFVQKQDFISPFHNFEQATFIKKSTVVKVSQPILTESFDFGFALYTQVQHDGKDIHICNVHGITSKDDDKNDTLARIEQSQRILDFMKDRQGIRIIGGDYNINPSAKSITMHEAYGYQNLINDYKIETTRNEYAHKGYPIKMLYSDYVFVDATVPIKNFSVPNDIVSDHLPLILEL